MAAVPLFRDTNMAAVTSRENTLVYICPEIQVIGHFRVHVCLLFKASLSAKFFL